MEEFDVKELKKLFVPSEHSHKGENGKVLIIAGSVLFHAASLWPLTVASKIVDMVFYSSVSMNNEIVQKDKNSFRNGIVIPREKLEKYILETDSVLIGPGLPRENGKEKGDTDTKELTESLLKKYPNKKWVVDGGSLQTVSPDILPESAIITPHKKEFEKLFKIEATWQNAIEMAKKYAITILLKGEEDLVANSKRSVIIKGGNAGMTKGGTGDVLAGLTASLYAKNEAFLSAASASYINKCAGDALYKKTGLYFNASDLADEIPLTMDELILQRKGMEYD